MERTKDKQAWIMKPMMKQDGSQGLQVVYPHDILDIHDDKKLKGLLDYYSNPMFSSVVGDSPRSRLFYVEKIRPALRYFCKRYGVDIPDWLEKDDEFTGLPQKEKVKLFGTADIPIVEFRSKHLEQGQDENQAAGADNRVS